jgi:hypothetical protein
VQAIASEDALLAVERLVVAVLVGDDLGQEARARDALLDGARGQRRDLDAALAGAACVLGSNDLTHPHLHRDALEQLGDLLADDVVAAAATLVADPLLSREGDLLASALEVLGDPRTVLASARLLGRAVGLLFLARPLFFDLPACLLHHLLGEEHQLVGVDLLRASAEEGALELRDAVLEAPDDDVAAVERFGELLSLGYLLPNDRLQRAHIVREMLDVDGHH